MDVFNVYIPLPVALGAVATIGYLFGRRTRGAAEETAARSRREMRRAQHVARELEKIADTVRRSLTDHHANLVRFRERVSRLSDDKHEAAYRDLYREVEEVLRPTLRLANEFALAYDEVRQQSANLMSFTEIRTDPLTGVSNRRGLEESLDAQMAIFNRYRTDFAIAIFDVDHFKNVNDHYGHLQGDQILKDLATLLDDCARETDIVARYGGEEFVVIMPQTNLAGGAIFSERIRERVEQSTELTVSGGVTQALDGDTHESLLARADAALYQAKSHGRNCVFWNDGRQCVAVAEATETAEHV